MVHPLWFRQIRPEVLGRVSELVRLFADLVLVLLRVCRFGVVTGAAAFGVEGVLESPRPVSRSEPVVRCRRSHRVPENRDLPGREPLPRCEIHEWATTRKSPLRQETEETSGKRGIIVKSPKTD